VSAAYCYLHLPPQKNSTALHQLQCACKPGITLRPTSTGDGKDENGTEISRTDRFRFLYYGSVFKHKKLSVSIGFTTIFNHFLYSLIAKMLKCTEQTDFVFYFVSPFSTVFILMGLPHNLTKYYRT
jgi:hypothetical protein